MIDFSLLTVGIQINPFMHVLVFIMDLFFSKGMLQNMHFHFRLLSIN